MENNTTPKHTFKLGDIVALSSHPFLPSQHDILIGGEPQLISPLMIIIEIIRDSQSLCDENIDNQIQVKWGAPAQCKCMWYSSKSFQFEEAWLASKLLKKIKDGAFPFKENSGSCKYSHLQIGESVTLSTAKLELKKLKISYKHEGGKEKTSLNPLLSFVSPIMQIIGTAKHESKETSFDSKKGSKKKEVSELLIKCKWFNPSSEKMSEKLIPIEALTLIPQADEENLIKISAFIESKKFIKIKYGNLETIIKPQSIKCTHGLYYLLGYDYLLNTTKEFKINDKLELPESEITLYSIKVPDFNTDNLKIDKFDVQLKNVINKARQEKKFIRIKYADRNGNVTFRTIMNFKIESVDNDTYLVGKCLLRNSERYFLFERIQFLEVLNL